jgi:hypothetical protein
VDRRTFLLLGAGAVGLAGCTSGPVEPGPRPPASTAPTPSDPDVRLRDEVAASEAALIAAYRSAIAASPTLVTALTPFLLQHEEHVARVAPEIEAAPSGSPDARPEASPAGSPVPDDRDTLAHLADLEAQAHEQRASACDGAQEPGLARDLCLIAASEAQHAAALTRLARAGSAR